MENYDAVANEINNFNNNQKQIEDYYQKIYNKLKDSEEKYSHHNNMPDIHNFSNTKYSIKDYNERKKGNYKYSNSLLRIGNSILNYNRPEARQLMDLALMIPNQYYSTNEYTMVSYQFNKQFNNFLAKFKSELQFNNNINGIVFHKNSSISRELSNSLQLQREIRSVFTKFPDNVILSDFEFTLNEDANLHYAIGHYTIINPKINKDGKFNAYLFDIYDFKYQSLKELDNSIKIYILNNTAYILQEGNRIKNYYVLIPIEFDW